MGRVAGVMGAASLMLALLVPDLASWAWQDQVRRVATVDGFEVPESARYDPERDLFLVSNVTGNPVALDDTGFISLMEPDGRIRTLRWIDGRSANVTLHAPKGIALLGSSIWVADIAVVRSFDRHTGRPGPAVDLGPLGARFLNDVAAGPDGTLYVSDTGLVFENGRGRLAGPHRVYAIDVNGAPSVLIDDASLRAPNGVFFDTFGARLLIGSFAGPQLFAWTRAAGLTVAATGPGGYDGIERLPDGRILVASQDGNAILALQGANLAPLIPGVTDVGDIGVDTRRSHVAIPRLDTNLLEIWEVK